jgi:hypothetical protein
MTRWQRICTITVSISVAVGIMFGLLPRTWIELRLGVDPDGGDGSLECLLAAILISIGLAFAIYLFWQLTEPNFKRLRRTCSRQP